MVDVSIDITGEEGQIAVDNTTAFDLQLTGCGLCIDMTHEQGEATYRALAVFFGPDQESCNG